MFLGSKVRRVCRADNLTAITRHCAFIYRGVLVSTTLQAFVFFFLLLNVLLQLANKKWDSKTNKKICEPIV
jgi:hypothetical protein